MKLLGAFPLFFLLYPVLLAGAGGVEPLPNEENPSWIPILLLTAIGLMLWAIWMTIRYIRIRRRIRTPLESFVERLEKLLDSEETPAEVRDRLEPELKQVLKIMETLRVGPSAPGSGMSQTHRGADMTDEGCEADKVDEFGKSDESVDTPEEVILESELSAENLSTAVSSADEDREFLKKVEERIMASMDDHQIRIEELIAATKYNRAVFVQKIKNLTGMVPVEFIRHTRLQYAARLLKQSDLMVKEISYMVGMSDTKYFSRHFKNLFGMTPSEYREKQIESPPNNENKPAAPKF